MKRISFDVTLLVVTLFTGCSESTGLVSSTSGPAAGSYDLLQYDGKALPAVYEEAAYGNTRVMSGSLTLTLSELEVSVAYLAQDPAGSTLDSYNGTLSALVYADPKGGLTFSNGYNQLYLVTGAFHADSTFIYVPTTLSDGTSHTGTYTFVRRAS